MAEALRLNDMADEVLSFNLQGADASDHIGAAEGLLAFYEASMKLQLTAALEQNINIETEGTLAFFRLAAEAHVNIANAMSANALGAKLELHRPLSLPGEPLPESNPLKDIARALGYDV